MVAVAPREGGQMGHPAAAMVTAGVVSNFVRNSVGGGRRVAGGEPAGANICRCTRMKCMQLALCSLWV